MGRNSKQRAGLKALREKSQKLHQPYAVPHMKTAPQIIAQILQGIRQSVESNSVFFGHFDGEDGKGYPQNVVDEINNYFVNASFAVETHIYIKAKAS